MQLSGIKMQVILLYISFVAILNLNNVKKKHAIIQNWGDIPLVPVHELTDLITLGQ